MADFCIMRVKKLHSTNVAASIEHALRTRETLNAAPEKLPMNWNSITERKGTAEQAKKAALSKYRKKLPDKIRKNAVHMLEFMCTFSPDTTAKFKKNEYLNAADKWISQKFGKENVIMCVHHWDETTPHTSVFVMPLVDGKLNARALVGGRELLHKLQTDYAEQVGKPYGLRRGVSWSHAKHQDIRMWYGKQQEIADAIRQLPEKKLLESAADYTAEIKAALLPSLRPLLDLQNEQHKLHRDKTVFSQNLKAFETQKTQTEKELADWQTKLKQVDEFAARYHYKDVRGLRKLADEMEQQQRQSLSIERDSSRGRGR